ncbi:MAG: tetratricopeptide repeat protein [Gemmatimonadales bacterium]
MTPTPLPDQIGPYRILQVLGEGGMGVVYEAEETGLVRRRVAVKVLRTGLNSREVVARFETERQALAVMNHPGIARVFGAGTAEPGQPYFAMELVRGLPITTYCDTHHLTVEERLELFIAVCHAVQHAHQKGVTHRDLKPSNILVTEQDDVAQPKVIDFGIAKALGQQLTDATMVTKIGHALGTAAYMSPEQADPAGVDTDTRADIYSLGVLLYELLVGSLPVNPEEVGLHLFLARLAAGEANPPTPSSRLQTNRHLAASVATFRKTDPDRLRRRLRGDLDWIVMKAMAPERGRRYETANGLALELRRFLSNEPVLARPPSVPYWVGKFVRRHRVGVAVAGVAAVLVLGSTIAATLGFVRASKAKQVAAVQADNARAVTQFLKDLFSDFDPAQPAGNPVTALDWLDRGTTRARRQLGDQPLQQAMLLQTLGSVYGTWSQYDSALALLHEALRVRERELGTDHPQLVETLIALGHAAREYGKHDVAEQYYVRGLTIAERTYRRDQLEVVEGLSGLGMLRIRQGHYVAAESLLREVVDLDARVRTPGDIRIARNIRNLGTALYGQHRFGEAEPLYRRALALQEGTWGRQSLEVASTFLNLGALFYVQERYSDAEGMYQAAWEIYEARLGTEHIRVANVKNNLGEVRWRLGRPAEAEPLLREALAYKERTLDPNSTSIANTLNTLAGVLRDQRRYPEAEFLYRRALAIRTSTYDDPNHRATQETKRDYAALLRLMGRGTEADRLIGQ